MKQIEELDEISKNDPDKVKEAVSRIVKTYKLEK